MPTELQWLRLTSLVQVLGQTRWCIFNLYLTGDILYIEARHFDNPQTIHLHLIDSNGELL